MRSWLLSPLVIAAGGTLTWLIRGNKERYQPSTFAKAEAGAEALTKKKE